MLLSLCLSPGLPGAQTPSLCLSPVILLCPKASLPAQGGVVGWAKPHTTGAGSKP